MKKRIVALLLVLVMAVSCAGLLAGCGGDSQNKELAGTWVAELNMTEGFKSYFNEAMAAELASADLGDIALDDMFDLSRLNAVMEWKMVMGEDGAMTMSMDAQKMADSMRDVLSDSEAKIQAAVPSMVESIFAQQGMTLEEAEAVLAAQGMSVDDLIAQTSEAMSANFSEGLTSLDGSELSYEDSGYYIVDDGKLYVVDNKGDKPDPDDYLQFELKGDELVVTDMADGVKEAFADYEGMLEGGLLPITFHRG